MIAETIDRLISVVSPRWGLERISARATLQQIDALTAGTGGYNAGKLNRLTKGHLGGPLKEHSIPSEEVARLRWQAWDLYRNNPYARKIVRTIQSQVIGKGLRPASATVKADGSPDAEYRARVAQLWSALQKGFDFRGLPGRGGLSMLGLQKLALKSIVLGGEILWQQRPLDPNDQKRRGLPIPLSYQLIDCERLSPESTFSQVRDGNYLYRGIELDGDGRRVAYHITDHRPGDLDPTWTNVKRVDAARIIHTYLEDDVDQYRGVSWFAPCLLQMRDTGDYQYNELKAAAMAACVVLGYKKPTGKKKFGLQQATDIDTQDDDGNPITAIQPGMFVDLGTDGKLEGFNPMRPGSNAEAFIQHLLRGTAAGFPGVKSSTITGDYRNSSFSSERSADNDAWPELEDAQEWFAASAMQPIYEAVIEAAVMAGWFKGLSAAKFLAERSNYVACVWQGPIARSINPVDDAKAATERIHTGISSVQIECAALNRNWVEVLADHADLYEKAKELKLPEELVNQMLGVDSKDVLAAEMGAAPAAKPAAQAAKPKPKRLDSQSAVEIRDADPPEIEGESDDEDEIAVIGMELANA